MTDRDAIGKLRIAYKSSKQHPSLQWVSGNLLDAYVQDGQNELAKELYQEAVVLVRKSQEEGSESLARILTSCAEPLMKMKMFEEAESIMSECLDIRQRGAADSWKTFSTMSLLGAAMAGQGEWNKAEPLLREGFEGMKERIEWIPRSDFDDFYPKSIDRLIAYSESANDKDALKKWKREKQDLDEQFDTE